MSRLHRTLLRVLVADIVSGALPAGERLPTEIELAQRFGVSRGVARESLRGLEERGLVNVKHGSGATVLPSTDWDMFNPDVIAAVVEAPGSPAAEDLFHEADVGFHRAVIHATGNRALGRMTEPIHRALAAARRPLARPEHRLERSLPEHRAILAAIAARDPDAARAAMRDHLLTVERYLGEYAAGQTAAPKHERRRAR